MAKWKNVLGGSALALVVLLLIGITLTVGWRPFIGPRARAVTDRRFPSSPERLARGRYLVESVVGCVGCHSEVDMTAAGHPIVAGTEGSGRDWTPMIELPVFAPNITPDRETGVGDVSDDTLARATREGIGRDGRTLFPLMPYPNFKAMSDEDLASVIVYIRSLPPVKKARPRTELPFPVNRLINDAPAPVTEPVPAPDVSTPEKRGAYLVRMASCGDCHTPMQRGQAVAGLEFAGGNVFAVPGGPVASSNITQEPSGISYYDEALFIETIRTGKVRARPLNGVMPWLHYRGMTDADLKAMFAYLRTLPKARHTVDNSLPPTDCKRCGNRHGGGERNGAA